MLSKSKTAIFFFSLILPFLFIFINTTSYAQDSPFERIEIPSSMNPVGSGARALGMGGAFIAVADDATAASWNPAGLIQLETPEISIVGAYFDRTESNTFGTNPEASREQNVTNYNLNYLSATLPFTFFNRNMVVSASHQYLYDFTRDLEFPTTYSDPILNYNGDTSIDHQGGLSALGLAYSVQVTPKFSFGITLNFWQDGLYGEDFKIEDKETGSGFQNGDYFTYDASWSDTYEYRGVNSNLGILWSINSKITVGFIFKTPFTVDLTHKSEFNRDLVFPDFPLSNISDSGDDVTDEELDIPMSYGIGIAYRFSDNFTASFDIYRTEWGDFTLRNEDGVETSPITGEPINESDIGPTQQIRTGAEYLYIADSYVIPFRGGMFYDPSPAEDGSDAFYGCSFGTGFTKGKIVFDIAYQYRFGNDVSEYILKEFDFSQNVLEHTVYASVIYHF